MTGLTPAQREAAIKEASTWIRTPWYHRGKIKGSGVDCVQFIVQVYQRIGALGEVVIDDYAQEWALHRHEQKLLAHLRVYAHAVDKPRPADLAVYHYGRSFSHVALVVDWPRVIHANREQGEVSYDDGEQGVLADRAVQFWSLGAA